MIVTVLLILVIAVIVGFGVALAVRARREFRDQNEVVPGRPSSAPASWAGAHTPAARLHRRLRVAVDSAHTTAASSTADVSDAVARIESEAIAIDDQLVVAASLPERHRDAAVARVEPLVVSLEDAVARLAERLSDQSPQPELLESTLHEADIALEALARAREEVDQLDEP